MIATADGAGLLQAVLESPGDDDMRGVLADWCEDHGQAGRAGLLRTREPRHYVAADPPVETWDWWDGGEGLSPCPDDLPTDLFGRLAGGGLHGYDSWREYDSRAEALADFVRAVMDGAA
jgi:uncharacterized protein (TIGR02996 family)